MSAGRQPLRLGYADVVLAESAGQHGSDSIPIYPSPRSDSALTGWHQPPHGHAYRKAAFRVFSPPVIEDSCSFGGDVSPGGDDWLLNVSCGSLPPSQPNPDIEIEVLAASEQLRSLVGHGAGRAPELVPAASERSVCRRFVAHGWAEGRLGRETPVLKRQVSPASLSVARGKLLSVPARSPTQNVEGPNVGVRMSMQYKLSTGSVAPAGWA